MAIEWSREELIIAMEFYHRCPEKMHTDAHAKCQEVAALIDRTPGALDRIIRNIKYADTGDTGLAHASQTILDLTEEFRDDRQGLLDEAATIRAANGWPALDCSE
jgi:hypothetical protein